VVSTGGQFGSAQCKQCFSPEAAAKQKQARRIFALQQDQGSLQFALCSLAIAGAARQQTQMQSRHCKIGIKINRRLIMVDGGAIIAGAFAAQGEYITRAGVQLIEFKQMAAHLLSLFKLSTVRAQHGLQQQGIRIDRRCRRKYPDRRECIGEAFLP
jgi:hypothetical protein